MLMTANKPEARSITDKGRTLLQAIRAAGASGLTRGELSVALQKTLNKWDVAQLELMEREGLIESFTRPASHRPTLMEYVYRALPDASAGDASS